MRVILLPVADRPECVQALDYGFQLAKQVGANVYGCHVRPHKYSDIAIPAGEMVVLVPEAAEWELLSKNKSSKKSLTQAAAMFESCAGKQDYSVLKKPRATPGAYWSERTGSPDKVLSIMGPLSDLVIVSRPEKNGRVAQLFLNAALFQSARPVLVLPQSKQKTVAKRISIAWNQSAEAAKAVTAALPLLQHAEHVQIITQGPEVGLGPKAKQLVTYLAHWGVKAQVAKGTGKDDAKAILQAYKKANSDLLIMGAYSHSRLRQRLFGGVTDFMLQKANIPLFAYHN